MQALTDREGEYTSERARLSAEVARLERDLAGMQRDRAEEDRHLRAAAVESQAAAERAESRSGPSLLGRPPAGSSPDCRQVTCRSKLVHMRWYQPMSVAWH